jgi:hypothetical protein
MRKKSAELLTAAEIDSLPPSVNHAYCRGRHGTFKTAEAKGWQEVAALLLRRGMTRRGAYARAAKKITGVSKTRCFVTRSGSVTLERARKNKCHCRTSGYKNY